MQLHDAMYNRRSIRKFKYEEISDENIDLLMQYAMSAPSACNRMPWEFFIVKNEAVRDELKHASRFTNYISPLIIVVCGNIKKTLPLTLKDYWIQDCSAAIENILLGATSLGIGTCWCGLLPQEKAVKKVQKILNLEENLIPLGLIHLGYPDEEKQPRTQYDKENIHFI